MSPQERVLHQVRGSFLGDQVIIEPARGNQKQVFPARLEGAAQNIEIARAQLL